MTSEFNITSIEVLEYLLKGLKKIHGTPDIRISISQFEISKDIAPLGTVSMRTVLSNEDIKLICNLGRSNITNHRKKYNDIEKELKKVPLLPGPDPSATPTKPPELPDDEKTQVLDLLNKLDDITANIEDPEHKKIGRPSKSIREKLFCMSLMTYFSKSSRKSYEYINLAKKNGYISVVPHHNVILKYYSNNTVYDVLHKLVPDETKANHKGLIYRSNFKKEISQQNEQLILCLAQQLMGGELVRPANLLDKNKKVLT